MPSSNKRPPEAFRHTKLFEQGLGNVVVSRFKSDGTVEVGHFLLDVYCLGVKDAMFVRVSPAKYESEIVSKFDSQGGKTDMKPCCARKLVEDAVEYARKLGIPPHPDYKKGCRVFGGISVADCDQEFEFGNDGKPFFMQGPHDSPQKVAHIMSLLTDRCGEGNFHYLLAVPEF